MEFNISITELAAKEYLVLLDSSSAEGRFLPLRVWVSGGGCSGLQYGMAIDTEPASEKEDNIISSGYGFDIYVDNFSAQYLNGAEIDWSTSNMIGGFKVNNPNTSGSGCGCGNSFSIEGESQSGCGGCSFNNGD